MSCILQILGVWSRDSQSKPTSVWWWECMGCTSAGLPVIIQDVGCHSAAWWCSGSQFRCPENLSALLYSWSSTICTVTVRPSRIGSQETWASNCDGVHICPGTWRAFTPQSIVWYVMCLLRVCVMRCSVYIDILLTYQTFSDIDGGAFAQFHLAKVQ